MFFCFFLLPRPCVCSLIPSSVRHPFSQPAVWTGQTRSQPEAELQTFFPNKEKFCFYMVWGCIFLYWGKNNVVFSKFLRQGLFGFFWARPVIGRISKNVRTCLLSWYIWPLLGTEYPAPMRLLFSQIPYDFQGCISKHYETVRSVLRAVVVRFSDIFEGKHISSSDSG
jgi:hypothetical protein